MTTTERPTVAQTATVVGERPTTVGEQPTAPGDAHLASAAQFLLLATHPELVNLPIRWEVDAGTVTPRLPHGDPETPGMVEVLAKALELPVHSSPFTATTGVRMLHIWCEGRWGGAAWQITAYGPAEAGELL